MKTIIFLCKLFGIFVFKENETYNLVSKHSIKRAEQRIGYQVLLKIAMEQVIEKGTIAVHFDYHNNQHTEYAKKYKGYIWVMNKHDNKLITVYQVSHLADLYITRK